MVTETELWGSGDGRRLQRQMVAGLEQDGQVGLFVVSIWDWNLLFKDK